MSQLKVSLFGSFAVTLDEQVLRDFKTDKARGLLAYLAINWDQAQQRSKLAGLLWPDRPEARARQNLSQALYTLRRLLGDKQAGNRPPDGDQQVFQPFLLVQADSLQLNSNSDTWVDVHAFTSLLADSKNHPHERLGNCDPCLEDLDAAAALYRGDFLSNFWLQGSQAFDEWALVQRVRLRRLAQETLDSLTASRAARGELEQALGYAWRQVEMEPLWEHAQRQVIDLLARSGRRDAAVAQYEAYQQVLFNELGMAPETATQALIKRIRTKKTTIMPLSKIIHNLPAALTPFIGRKAWLARLSACLEDPACRLLTIIGPGGSGKTRLALEAARTLTVQFPHGVWLVPLARLQSVEAIPAAIAEALGLPLQEGSAPTQQLKDYMRAKRLLLVLDSHEHLQAGARLAVELLEEAPGVKILATSRHRLNVQGEQLFSLSGLEIPQPATGLEAARRSEAVQLFVAAGQRARPGFDLSPGNLENVVRICALVAGMPLGLLLAAAWLDSFSCAEVAAEIGRELDFLSAPWEDLPARQRSLRATFDYSWGLLREHERRALRSLTVFLGGFNGQAAAEVAGAPSLVLRTLVEKSMLERSLTGRFKMHELLCQYTREKLAKRPDDTWAASEAHAAYYLGRLPAWAEALKGPRQVDVLKEMDLEAGNLKAAWTWAAEKGQVSRLDQGLEGLCLYYDMRANLQEGKSACQHALNHMPAGPRSLSPRIQGRINTWKAHFLRLLGHHEASAHLLRQELAVLEDLDSYGPDIRLELGLVNFELGHAILPNDRLAAREHYQASLALYEDTGDWWRQAQALAGLGKVAHHAGTFAQAVAFYQRSLMLYEPLGDPKSTAGVLIELGHNWLRQGSLEEGEAYINRGCEIYEQIGDRASLSDSLFQLARLYFWHGKFSEMLPLIDKTRPVFEELGWYEKVIFNIIGKGIPLVLSGDYEAAFKQGKQGLALAQEYKFQRWQAASYWVLGMTELAKGELEPARDTLQSSVEIYRGIAQNDELGWALATLTYAQLEMETEARFWKSLRQALQLGLEIHALFTIMLALPAAALYFIKTSRTAEDEAANQLIARAVELYALARRYPSAGNAQWFEDVAGKRISAAAACLPPAVLQAARERGQSQEAFAVARELLAEFCQGFETRASDS